MRFLKESDYWDEQRIADYQLEQLRMILKHCRKNIPYYQELFSTYGFNPDNLQSLQDLNVLPYLQRETVRDRLGHFADMSMKGQLLVKSTSGSTGIPLTVHMSRESSDIYHAFLFHSFNRIHYNPRYRMVKFWNMLSLHNRRDLPFMKIGNKLILSKRYLSDDWLMRYAEMIRRFSPLFITGCPSTLSILSACMKKNNMSLTKKLKAVIVHGETAHDWQRNLIEEVFATRVFSVYSMTEGALFSSECEFSPSQHIYPQSGIAEFADCGNGQKEIIATGLTNPAMPFIRYRTSDLAAIGNDSCARCGRRHQLIDKIEGRINDFLINKDGRIIPRLLPWIEVFPNTRQCQFFQEVAGKAVLRIVRSGSYAEADTLNIKAKLAEMLGPMNSTIDIEIEFVDSIPRSPTGKLNLVEQRLEMRKFLA